jgi:outer membrane protein assembly factor BamB
MSERDPLDNLRDLIDAPVAPRESFADELRSRLMREMSASSASREEQAPSMDAVIAPRPIVAFPTESARRIRPMVILELAAVAVIVLGLAAALNRGWFQGDPEPPTSVPAAALQDDETPTPELEQTPTPEPTVVPDGEPTTVPDQDADMTLEPTVVPPGDIPNTIWAVPLPGGESLDFGGMLVDDDTVYRLLATPSFVGVQAVDGETGVVKWQQAHKWTGSLFEIEDDVLYFDGGDNTLVAIDAETGAERWSATVEGNPIALDEDDSEDDTDRIFVLLDTDFVTALDQATGERLWVAQIPTAQTTSGGSASIPAIGKIAVENDTVAAISTTGVLTGFDVATGEARWSHEGYDAALVTILTEDDIFVVSEGYVGFGAGIGTATGGSSAPEGDESGSVQTDAVPANVVTVIDGSPASGSETSESGQTEAMPATAADDACDMHFSTEDVVTSAAPASGSPEAGASSAQGSNFRVQGIDPATGDILWEQQAAAGGATVAGEGAAAPGGDTVVCSIDAEHGTVSGVVAAGSSASGAVEFDEDDNLIAIGVVSGDDLVTVGPITGGDDGSAVILTVPDGVASTEVMAVASGDGGTFLQLTDGTLVKVETSGPSDDDDHHEDRDDDDGSPESESGDDADDTPESDDE